MNATDTLKAIGRRPSGAFTLIEMIGVLGVIGILVAVLDPQGGRHHQRLPHQQHGGIL